MRARSLALLAALFGPQGLERDELLILLALALIARGCWLVWQPAAYLAPGVVLLWMTLPARKAFVVPAPIVNPPSRRTD